MTSSVFIDRNGSIKTNSNIEATPLITPDKDKQVARRVGSIIPAYIGAKEPTTNKATANALKNNILFGSFLIQFF